MEEQIKKLIEQRNYFEKVAHDNHVLYLQEKIRREEMEAALEFYANVTNYHHVETAAYSNVVMDEGELARRALEGGENE